MVLDYSWFVFAFWLAFRLVHINKLVIIEKKGIHYYKFCIKQQNKIKENVI